MTMTAEYEQLLAEAAADPRFLPVLADWLEDNGYGFRAEFVRWCVSRGKRPIELGPLDRDRLPIYWTWILAAHSASGTHRLPDSINWRHYPRTRLDLSASWAATNTDATDGNRRYFSAAEAWEGGMLAWERSMNYGWEGER